MYDEQETYFRSLLKEVSTFHNSEAQASFESVIYLLNTSQIYACVKVTS